MPLLSHTRRSIAGALLVAVGLAPLIAAGCSREPERSVAAFCAQVKNVEELDAVLATGDRQRIDQQVNDLRTLQQVSPPEIEPSVGILVSVTDDLARTVATSGQPDLAADEVFTRRQGEKPAIEAAGKAMELYTYDNCRVFLNGTGVPGTGTSSTTTSTTSTTIKGQPTTTLPKH